jgi:hypothetical protein
MASNAWLQIHGINGNTVINMRMEKPGWEIHSLFSKSETFFQIIDRICLLCYSKND